MVPYYTKKKLVDYFDSTHTGGNQIYSFHRLLGHPQGPQKPSEAIKNDGFLVEFHSFFQFRLNIRAPNLKIQNKWIMAHLLTHKKPLGASK